MVIMGKLGKTKSAVDDRAFLTEREMNDGTWQAAVD
jgi:hypothetical protein